MLTMDIDVECDDAETEKEMRTTLESHRDELRQNRRQAERIWWIRQEIGPVLSQGVLQHLSLPNRAMSLFGWSLLPHAHLRQWSAPTSRHSSSIFFARPHIAVGPAAGLDYWEAVLRGTEEIQILAALLTLITDGAFEHWEVAQADETRREALRVTRAMLAAAPEEDSARWAEATVKFHIRPEDAERLVSSLGDEEADRFTNALHIFHQGVLASRQSISLGTLALVSAGEALAYGEADPCPTCNQPRYQSRKRYLDWFCGGLHGQERTNARKFGDWIYSKWRSPTVHKGILHGTEIYGAGRIASVMAATNPWELSVSRGLNELRTFYRLMAETRRATLHWLESAGGLR